MNRMWTLDQMMTLAARWEAGETLVAIGASHGISANRVRQLIARARQQTLRAWMLANGWTVERVGGRWISPPGPPESWPKYDKPVR